MALQHAAAVVGRRMVVVGGLTASGPTNDVQVCLLVNLQKNRQSKRSFYLFEFFERI